MNEDVTRDLGWRKDCSVDLECSSEVDTSYGKDGDATVYEGRELKGKGKEAESE